MSENRRFYLACTEIGLFSLSSLIVNIIISRRIFVENTLAQDVFIMPLGLVYAISMLFFMVSMYFFSMVRHYLKLHKKFQHYEFAELLKLFKSKPDESFWLVENNPEFGEADPEAMANLQKNFSGYVWMRHITCQKGLNALTIAALSLGILIWVGQPDFFGLIAVGSFMVAVFMIFKGSMEVV